MISNNTGETDLTASECKELIEAFNSKSNHCPLAVSTDGKIIPNCYASLDEIHLIIKVIDTLSPVVDLRITKDGLVTESQHNDDDLNLFVEKIF